jgi:hypothetical protein
LILGHNLGPSRFDGSLIVVPVVGTISSVEVKRGERDSLEKGSSIGEDGVVEPLDVVNATDRESASVRLVFNSVLKWSGSSS